MLQQKASVLEVQAYPRFKAVEIPPGGISDAVETARFSVLKSIDSELMSANVIARNRLIAFIKEPFRYFVSILHRQADRTGEITRYDNYV